MYDKNLYKRDVTCSWPPPPVRNCHTFSDLLPLERDVLYGRPLTEAVTAWIAPMILVHRISYVVSPRRLLDASKQLNVHVGSSGLILQQNAENGSLEAIAPT